VKPFCIFCFVFLRTQYIRYNAMQNSHFVSHFTVGYISRFRISQLAENEAANSSFALWRWDFLRLRIGHAAAAAACQITARGYYWLMCYCCSRDKRQDSCLKNGMAIAPVLAPVNRLFGRQKANLRVQLQRSSAELPACIGGSCCTTAISSICCCRWCSERETTQLTRVWSDRPDVDRSN